MKKLFHGIGTYLIISAAIVLLCFLTAGFGKSFGIFSDSVANTLVSLSIFCAYVLGPSILAIVVILDGAMWLILAIMAGRKSKSFK